MSLFNKNKNIGFTLIELTTVIAVIGVLSAIAIPQYSKFQAKARTSEAKLALAGIYSVELAFKGDANSYASCLGDMGFNPGEKSGRSYTVGFKTTDALGRKKPDGTAAGATDAGALLNQVLCSMATTATGNTFFVGNDNTNAPGSALTDAIVSSASEFDAGAVAKLDTVDLWRIDEAKVLTHPTIGY